MGIKKIGLRWWMISLIMLGSVINYLARSTLGVAAPTMMEDLKMSAVEYSYVLTGFKLTYLAQPLAGFIMDVVGLRLGFTIMAALWSIAAIVHGFVGSWQQLFFARTLLGLPESSVNAAGVKASAEWFPAKERGMAAGVFNIGASLGSMIAPPLVVWAILYHNWQFAFIITGAIGIVWSIIFFSFFSTPEKSKYLSNEERTYIRSGQEAFLQDDVKRPSVKGIIIKRNFWGIAIPRFLADPTWSTLSFWVPLYLTTVRHMNLSEIAMFAWMPFLAADLGCIFGGMVSGRLINKYRISVINARRWTFTLGAVLMLGMPFVGFVENSYVAVALLCLGGFAHQTLSVQVITMASDLFRKGEVATAAGCAGTMSGLGTLLFGLAVGALVVSLGYELVFVLLALFDVLGAVVLWTVVRDPNARLAGSEARALPAWSA